MSMKHLGFWVPDKVTKLPRSHIHLHSDVEIILFFILSWQCFTKTIPLRTYMHLLYYWLMRSPRQSSNRNNLDVSIHWVPANITSTLPNSSPNSRKSRVCNPVPSLLRETYRHTGKSYVLFQNSLSRSIHTHIHIYILCSSYTTSITNAKATRTSAPTKLNTNGFMESVVLMLQ